MYCPEALFIHALSTSLSSLGVKAELWLPGQWLETEKPFTRFSSSKAPPPGQMQQNLALHPKSAVASTGPGQTLKHYYLSLTCHLKWVFGPQSE